MSDDQATCPNCGSRCGTAPMRTLQFAATKRYVCPACGEEWRHAWQPYVATTALCGGGSIALGAGGVALWTFLAADSGAFGWQSWRTVGFALAVAAVAGVSAKQGWRYLRSGPSWTVVERPGRTVEPIGGADARPSRATRWKRSRWKGAVEWVGVACFWTLVAVFGTETPQPFRQREPPPPLQGPSRVVQESLSLMPRASVPSDTDPPSRGADAEPFSEDVQRTLDDWRKGSSAVSEEPSTGAERYYDRSWSKAAE